MRRTSFDNQQNSRGQDFQRSNVSYGVKKDVDHTYSLSYLQRSISADDVIRSRGFKPSDRHDPVKRNFLEHLTSKILHFDMESGERTPINLKKLLTPASDSQELLHAKNKKMFASSYFYAPTHPTVEDQVELARRISLSLSDAKNMKSKGQSMYVNRKKRSVKWIHDGNGTEREEEPSSPMHKDKLPLKCVMNPHGKVLDIHGIQALGEEVNIEPMPSHPEKLFDIVRDLNNQRGRGAEIFAKRRKRSEKWVVDQDQTQIPNTPGALSKMPGYPQKSDLNGNSKFSPYQRTTPMDQPFYNPFTVDLSLDSGNLSTTGRSHHHSRRQRQPPYCRHANECAYTNEVKKIYLREVAVGTDAADFPVDSRSCCTENSHDKHIINGTSNATANSNSRHSNEPLARNKYGGEARHSLQNGINQQNGTSSRRPDERDVTEDSEYTPVPVKQLIQEFEKTCRPTLQYKQISPKVVPLAQQYPVDTDIARFFQTKTTTKYEEREETEDYEDDDECVRASEDTTKLRAPYSNGYISTDETEYTSENSDYDEQSMYHYEKITSDLCNGNREYSNFINDEYSRRRRSVTSQELESLAICPNGEMKYTNTEAELPAEAKSLLLSMIASQEGIVETIKHLRSTPVLDNLLPGISPDCKFDDVYAADVGTKLYENNEYKGPKLASLHNLTNYNTAPRGWDQSLTFYRPVKFEKPETIVYSDF